MVAKVPFPFFFFFLKEKEKVLYEHNTEMNLKTNLYCHGP